VRACLVAVTSAESARFVWLKVDLRTADAELISRMGHELSHALEVIEEPTVRDNGSMFFSTNGSGHTWRGARLRQEPR